MQLLRKRKPRKRPRPLKVIQVVQVYKGHVIYYLVPLYIGWGLIDLANKYTNREIKGLEFSQQVITLLDKHVKAGGVIEGIIEGQSTTSDMTKYSIQDFLFIPSSMGVLGLIPGYELETETTLSLSTGQIKNQKIKHLPGKTFNEKG